MSGGDGRSGRIAKCGSEKKMHIPDGYLGPTTYLTCYALVAPFWAGAWRALRRKLQTMEVPYLALGAAFIFVVMMFNVPIPGGTTGHVVGASIVAISFGGWAAVLAVSFALLIQALIFGDGGVTALGANCLNMAVVQTFVTLGVWKLLRPADVRTRRWRTFGAAFAAGYLGLLAAAFATAVQFGLQPLLERAPDGTPLFCPFPLRIAVPAMVISHLFVGLLEGVVTGLVIVALAKAPDSIVTESANLLPAAVFWRGGVSGRLPPLRCCWCRWGYGFPTGLVRAMHGENGHRRKLRSWRDSGSRPPAWHIPPPSGRHRFPTMRFMRLKA
jgi:cobalt/nickel transport system permease protein